MWWGGVAHYDSKLLPHSKTFDDKGDQIAQCVEMGKKYGVEVHPWKVNWNLGNAPKEFVDQMRAAGRLQATHTGEQTNWLCPSHPDNYKLELDTMLEVVRNYDVDGVHFDYIRYPDDDSCYCAGCRQRFEAARGKPVENWPADCYNGALKAEYRQWRCDQISRLVRATAEQSRKIKPWVKISAAVFSDYPGCKNSVGQDWVTWCRQGWLDFVCPMDYTNNDGHFERTVASQVGYVGGAIPIYPGIGHFIITDDQAIGQMEIQRAQGADGDILFVMGKALAETGLPKFGEAITAQAAVLPHNAPVVRFATALDDERPVIQTKEDKLTVEVTLVGLGEHRQRATAATGTIELQNLDGHTLAKFGDLPKVGQSVKLDVPRREGVFRLAAVGELKFEGGQPQRFIRRSRPYAFEAK
jgi:hypothetical protein